MPGSVLLRSRLQHRIAAIALYRALISRCTSATHLRDEECASLYNVIRNKFRQNRKVQSERQLDLVFRAGYEVLDHLDAATTPNSKSICYLKELIPSIPRGLARTSPHHRPRSLPPAPSDTPTKQPLAVLPPEYAVLKVRPYARTSGPRHVPILASANGIPFLRLKKPQPESLSRVIRQKLDNRIKMFDNKIILANYWKPLAMYEEEWDRILEMQCGFVEADEDSVLIRRREDKWQYEVTLAEDANSLKYEKEMAADREVAANMVKLIDEETKLAILEGQKVVRGRKNKPIRDRWLK